MYSSLDKSLVDFSEESDYPDFKKQTSELTMANTQQLRGQKEDQKFKAICGYIVSLRPAWATQDPVPKPKIKSKHTKNNQEPISDSEVRTRRVF